MAEPDKISYRPVKAIGLLLVLQVAGMAGFGVHEAAQVDWDLVDGDALAWREIEAIAYLVFFFPPAVLTFLAALSLLLFRRRGWLLATISQGLTLGVCLWLYSELEPVYVYPIMLYCILMVLYLNSQDVRMVFHSGRTLAKQRKTAHGS